MRRQFWPCEIQKNWDGSLREEMLDRNIVCYGKPNSGKTDKVTKPFLRRAVEQGRWVMLVTAGDGDDYSDIYRQAEEAGYAFVDHEAVYLPDHDRDDLQQIGDALVPREADAPVFIRAKMDPEYRYHYSSVEVMLSTYCELVQNRRQVEKFMLEPLSLAVENSNWELFVPMCYSQCDMMNLCITLDNRRLTSANLFEDWYRSFRMGAIDCDKTQKDPTLKVLSESVLPDPVETAKRLDENIQILYKNGRAVASTADRAFARSIKELDLSTPLARYNEELRIHHLTKMFFHNIQTVICTGANGAVPEEHRAFLRACIVSEGFAPPGGKYLVTELTAPLQAIPKSVFPKTVVSFREKEPISDAYKRMTRPGRCVLEQNGVVKMFAAYDGVLVPFVFSAVSDALTWVEQYYAYMGWGWPEPDEVDMLSMRFVLPTVNESGKHDEFVISYIQKSDVQSYIDQMTMVAMGVEEYLENPSLMAEVPDLDMKHDAPNISLQKLVSFACRNYYTVRKVASAQLPVDEETNREVESMIEAYKWRPYQRMAAVEEAAMQKMPMEILPAKKVLFLGGHANMVKKLRQAFPDWDYLTDDELGSWTGGECEVIFFWTAHCSHLLQRYVDARKGKETPYLYVTATNIDRLIEEMAAKYKAHTEKQHGDVRDGCVV